MEKEEVPVIRAIFTDCLPLLNVIAFLREINGRTHMASLRTFTLRIRENPICECERVIEQASVFWMMIGAFDIAYWSRIKCDRSHIFGAFPLQSQQEVPPNIASVADTSIRRARSSRVFGG
jgi:hypothetical protein